MKQNEKKTQNDILKYLKNLPNCFVQRREAGGFAYKKGLPDIYCVYNGIHYEIEVKDANGETSVMQDKYKDILTKAGCVYILAKSLEDVLQYIK